MERLGKESATEIMVIPEIRADDLKMVGLSQSKYTLSGPDCILGHCTLLFT